MKKLLFLLTCISIFSISCKKKSVDANVSIVFNNQVDGQAIVKDKLIYTNTAGNKYSVTLLKYYITNTILVQEDGTEFKLNNYDLIDEFSKDRFSSIEAQNVPGGHYTKLKFNVGIDKSRNHEGAQDGDLDPINAMIWSWNTGYIFLKHEGQYITPAGDTTVMQFHLATDDALRNVEIPINLTVKGEDKKLNLVFDLNKMYNQPIIDIDSKPIMHSIESTDSKFIQDLANNSADAFSFLNEE